MSEKTSNNSTLIFLVGGLLVAVLVIGYFTIGGSGNAEPGAPAAVAAGSAEETGTKFKLDVDKDGGISGSVEGTSK